jgi:hypothetical protein
MGEPRKGGAGPLAGMRVLELAQIMAGPTAGMMLADMGADVVKVEKLPGGDDSRGYREPRVNGVSAPFLILNRNKRGMALNLKHARGREVLLRLVRGADVLTENYRRGALEKLGLGYDVLSKANPGLIYCAISGYGRDGPWADKGGFDLIAQGVSGLMSITGEPDGPPVKTGNPVADINAGILAVTGILAAWAHKLRTGEGQIVDTSLMEAALQQTYWHAAIHFATGESPGRMDQHRRREPGELGAHRRGAGPSRVARRRAFPHQFRPDGEPVRAHRADERGARDAHEGRVDRQIRRGRRAGGAGQLDRRGALASAGARARHGRRPRASAGGRDEGARLPGAFLRDTDVGDATRTDAGRALARGACGGGLLGRGDRRVRRRGRRRCAVGLGVTNGRAPSRYARHPRTFAQAMPHGAGTSIQTSVAGCISGSFQPGWPIAANAGSIDVARRLHQPR